MQFFELCRASRMAYILHCGMRDFLRSSPSAPQNDNKICDHLRPPSALILLRHIARLNDISRAGLRVWLRRTSLRIKAFLHQLQYLVPIDFLKAIMGLTCFVFKILVTRPARDTFGFYNLMLIR